MSDISGVAPGGGEGASASIAVVTPAANTPEALSVSQAARALAAARHKPKEQTVEPQSAPEGATAEPPEKLADEANAAPPEEAPGETPEVDPVVEQPSVDPPRSWPKDAKDAFKLLPPALQKDVAELERSREVETRRGQNEVAEARKAAEAARVQAEQLRQQYEVGLQGLQQEVQKLGAGEFADIKTQEDVDRLANEDWPRFARFQAHQMKVANIQRENAAAQERQQVEFDRQWSEYASKQDQLLNDRAPELADKAKADKLTKAAQEYLSALGFKPEELASAWNGKASLALRDHRVQLLILDGVKFREATAAKPAPKPVPPVQRPGVAKPAGGNSEVIQALSSQLERTGSLKAAQELRAAQLKTRRA